jgi:hypothetical protein
MACQSGEHYLMAAGVDYVILAEFQPWDPVAGAAVTVRACSIDHPQVTALNGVTWWPAISSAPKRTLDLFDGEFGGRISAGIGDIELALAAFSNAARFAWGERPVKLWRGVFGAAWGDYTLIFEGLTRPPRASNGRMRIGLRVDDRWLDRSLLATYAGTGATEGPADLKGQPKPLALGAPQFVEGVIINRAANIVQLHGYGAINGIPTALSRLSRYSGSAGNDANYAALAAATIAPGAWRTCLADGLVRFGAPPGGVASFLMQGDSGSALGWVRTPGQVIRRIALIAGATAGQIDTASLAALDTACPYNISLYLREQTTARDVIQSIAASCNAAAGVSWLGRLFVTRAGIGSPALTLAANGTALPPVAAVEMLESSAPFWRTALEAERTWRVHSAGEFELMNFGDLADSAAVLAAIQAAQDAADDAAAIADGKIATFYQASAPTGALGDLWFDTDDGNRQYRFDGTSWVVVRDAGIGTALTNAAGAQATADGKVTTFYGETTPTAEAIGDLWYRASTKTLSRWSGTAWDVSSATNVADNATRDRTGNLLDAAAAANEAAGWSTSGGAATAVNSTGGGWGAFVNPRFLGIDLSVAFEAFNQVLMPVGGTGRQYAAIRYANGSPGSAALAGLLYFYDAAGTLLSPQPAFSLPRTASGVYSTAVISGAVPAGAVSWRIYFGSAAPIETANWRIDNIVALHNEPGADVTATAVPSLSVPPLVTVNFDFTGTASPGALPATLRAVRKRGDVDVSTSTSWSLTGSGFTGSIASDGAITITAVTASTIMTVVSTRDGVTLSQDVGINRVVAPPPALGGTGGTTANDSSIDSIASNSYGAAIAGPMTVKTGSVGRIDLYAPLTITRGATAPTGTFGVRLKWQWRIVGGTYADAASEVSEDTPLVVTLESGVYFVEDGAVTCNAAVTGLSANTDYEVQLLGRTNSGTTSRGMIGTASAVGS